MKIVTSLSFPGTCREAFEFYAQALGGKVTAALTYSEAPHLMPVPDRIRDWLMHCWLEVGDQALMGSDMHPDYAPDMGRPKNGFDVTLHVESVAEGQRMFDVLASGGEVRMPFAESFWSPGFGGLTDRFGVPWMINVVAGPDWKPAHERASGS